MNATSHQAPNQIIINTSAIFAPLNSFAKFDTREIDVITRSSYQELITQQKIKNLPYVLALVQDKNYPNLHHLDGASISQWNKHHNTNPKTANTISHIFYFSIIYISKSKKYITEYLGKSSDNVEKKDFINKFIQASSGNAKAQFYLGLFYDQAIGIEKDYIKAVYWWKLAADQGHIEAQFDLAHNYYHGDGVKKDHKKSIELWTLAATKGHIEAIHDLIVCYEYGIGVPQNTQESLKWRNFAEKMGHRDFEW